MQYFTFRCIYRVEPRKNGPTNHCCSTFFPNFVISKIVPLQTNKNDYEKVSIFTACPFCVGGV